jgi:hypothetical protein
VLFSPKASQPDNGSASRRASNLDTGQRERLRSDFT